MDAHPPNGSTLFLADHADALFGNIDVVERQFPVTLSTVTSDDFSSPVLDTERWSFVDPLGDASFAPTGSELAICRPRGRRS